MTYEHKYKCMRCGVHYVVLSWEEDRDFAFCPECGTESQHIHWLGKSEQQIFELVPGGDPLVSMGGGVVGSETG